MADTLEIALTSVLDQLDENYEVLVIDDGSSDNSVEILEKLSKEYALLRYISLPRDRNRKLGETRNYSIEKAFGEYVILHVDADDLWEPYIGDFVAVFHRLENCVGRDFLLSGQQINIGKREFLMKHGPYRNTHRLQDRDMWIRLAAEKAFIRLEHKIFRERMSRPRSVIFRKSISNTWYRLIYDLRGKGNKTRFIFENIIGVLVNKNLDRTYRNRIGRMFMIIPAFIVSRFNEPLETPEVMNSPGAFAEYREQTGGTFAELMARNGCDPSLDFLGPNARKIFLQNSTAHSGKTGSSTCFGP